MRVDYTLPSMQPDTLLESPTAGELGPSFRDQLHSSALVALPQGWEQQFQLDARPFTSTYIGPPPRPHTLEVNDPETERSRWRNMLFKHSTVDGSADQASPSAHNPVRTMLNMLLDSQDMEDSIISQSVAVTRG
jgi:hypothetical protein